MRDVPCQVCQIYINNRYFTYIITYLYNHSALLPLGFSTSSPSGRGRPDGGGTAIFGRKSRMAGFQRFRVAQGRHGGGTAVFGAFRRSLGKSPTRAARPSPVLGDLGRPRTGPAAFRGGGGSEGPHGGPVARGNASCGLSWVSCGLLNGPRPAVGLQRSPARGAAGGPTEVSGYIR